MRIFKFPLNGIVTQLKLPDGARIVKLDKQFGQPCVWVLLDPAKPADNVFELSIYGTGHELPKNVGEYVDTFQMENGALIWHVFMRLL